MNFLSVTDAMLPPGFRFHPRDDELFCNSLARKIPKDESHEMPAMVEVDLNKCEPWYLPSFLQDWVLCRVFHKNRGASTKSSTDESYDEPSSSSLPGACGSPLPC